MRVPFFRPSIGDEEISEVVECLKSGWITTGPRTAQFEEEFKKFFGGAEVHVAALNSATAALHLGLEALGIGPGDEVICPVMTFTATAEVVRYLGADPIFIDCDPRTLNILPDAIEAVVTPRTKAVIPVHFAGLACNMPGILDVAKRLDLKVLEDAAHALPTTVNNQMIGACGADASAFSFYANKTMTTGEGGMLVSPDPEIIDRVRKMRLHGIDRDVFGRFSDLKAGWQYDVIAPGFKYNMTDLAAAIGIWQLKKCREFAKKRAALVARYDAELADLPLTLPAHANGQDQHSWHLYIIRLREGACITRDKLIQELKQQGIGTSVHYTPLHLLSYWKDRYNLKSVMFPAATDAFHRCVSLPLFVDMTEEEQHTVINAVKRILSV